LEIVQRIALQIPAIRRLRDERNALRSDLARALDRQGNPHTSANSPFYHFNSSFDAEAVVRAHAASNLSPRPEYLTNYLGVLIHPKYFPGLLDGRSGVVEQAPIPANWHADMSEWGAALRAVDLARDNFTVIELGCGWGCWLNNTGVAARCRNLNVHLIGVEGDPGHIAFAREATTVNGFRPEQVILHHGLAAAASGIALFPRQERAGVSWGLEPIFNADEAVRAKALEARTHDELAMISIAELSEGFERIDLLHIDIQGGEADLVAGSLDILLEKVAYLVIGTHSRQIEGSLFSTLLEAGWILEIERPALLAIESSGPRVTVDGVQGWRNPRLLPN
jgi:uncharacterized small protein (DUF1192 family)